MSLYPSAAKPSSVWVPSGQDDTVLDAVKSVSNRPGDQSWLPLHRLWEASAEQVQSGLPATQMPPAWQLLVLSDGFTTRNLTLITGSAITAHMIRSQTIEPDPSAPADLTVLGSSVLQRQVWLGETGSQLPLLYATSWWRTDQIGDYLPDPSLPIGRSLSQSCLETYRSLLAVYLGQSDPLAQLFQSPGPFWGRHYWLWHRHQPLTLIYEVFSPALAHYLGAANGSRSTGRVSSITAGSDGGASDNGVDDAADGSSPASI